MNNRQHQQNTSHQNNLNLAHANVVMCWYGKVSLQFTEQPFKRLPSFLTSAPSPALSPLPEKRFSSACRCLLVMLPSRRQSLKPSATRNGCGTARAEKKRKKTKTRKADDDDEDDSHDVMIIIMTTTTVFMS